MNNKAYEPTFLGSIPLKNRIIRSATHEGMADSKGYPTQALIDLYAKLAKGGVGMIVTGYAGVRQDGRGHTPGMLMIDHDDCIGRYQELTNFVHQLNTPIILQLAHAGKQTRSKVTGWPTLSPSPIRDKIFSEDKPKMMNENVIQEIIEAFAKGALRAKKAGFDGVQLHAAHGYLLSEFLSPYSNKRKDSWGGSTEGRVRIIHEIIKRCRELCGDYPVFVKINASDHRKNGMTLDEAVKISRLLEKSGCAAIEVSCGIYEDGFHTIRGQIPVKELIQYSFKFKKWPRVLKMMVVPIVKRIIRTYSPALEYNVEASEKIKNAVNIPVIVVGGIRSKNRIQLIINSGKADCVSMARPLICEPDLVDKMIFNKQESSRCIECNHCMVGLEIGSLKCYYGRLRT